MRGWAQDITYGDIKYERDEHGELQPIGRSRCHPALGHYEPIKGVVGIVVAAKFPEPELIREKLEEGIARVGPDTVWVMRSPRKRGDAISVAWDVLEEHGIEPVLAPSNTAFWSTNARMWRDAELFSTCERLIVFHDISSNVTEYFIEKEYTSCKVFKIERGKKKAARPRKGRKPTGV